MKKTLIGVGFVTGLLLIGLLLYLNYRHDLAMQQLALSMISPTESKAVHILSIEPADGAVGVPLATTITVMFDGILKPDNYRLSIDPPIEVEQTLSDAKLTLKPKTQLQPSTRYTFLIEQISPHTFSKTYSFSTAGGGPITQPNTAPPAGVKLDEDYNLKTHPDIFLANKLPYEDSNFKMISTYQSVSGKDLYFFTITMKGTFVQTKQAVVAWLHSLGLQESQINQLDLRYVK